jgi:hypothetical protein
MKLYKQVQQISIETLSSIDFDGKQFHLSGDFSPSKKDFGAKLEEVGATYHGINEAPNHHEHLALRDTDYLVLADDGITHSGEKRDHGNNAKKVQAHNDKTGQKRHIPIISESHCKKLLDDFLLRKSAKP